MNNIIVHNIYNDNDADDYNDDGSNFNIVHILFACCIENLYRNERADVWLATV